MLGGGGVSPDDLGYSGSYTLTTGRFGQGISIGLADYLYATDSADLNPGPNGFTLALYTYGIDVQTIGKAGSHIASKYYPENGWYLGSDIDPERIEGGFSGDGRHHELPLFDDTVEGAWRHIVLTFDGVDTAKLYVDGELEVTREDVYFRPSDVPLYFGVASHDPGALWHQYAGIYDDIAIFDEPLTPEDIERLSREGLVAMATPIPEPSTILLFSSSLIGLAGLRSKFRRKDIRGG